jgi:hypothetical protein
VNISLQSVQGVRYRCGLKQLQRFQTLLHPPPFTYTLHVTSEERKRKTGRFREAEGRSGELMNRDRRRHFQALHAGPTTATKTKGEEARRTAAVK